MDSRKTLWIDPQDDECDNGDPVEAAEKFLKSCLPETRSRLVGLSRPQLGPDVPGTSADEQPSDGPQPRGKFVWRGVPCDFSGCPKRYRLVTTLWDAGARRPYPERDVSDVISTVWLGDEVSDNAVKNLLHAVRKVFRDKGVALDVRCRGGKVWLEELS